jgi:ABC-2 type transport system permease protein
MPTTTPRRRHDEAARRGHAARRGDATERPFLVEVRSPAAVWWRTYVHHLRLLRNGAIAWIAALAGIGWGVAATFDMRHGSEEELQALSEMVGVPAFEAMMGRYVEPHTVEGLVLSRWGWFGILAAIWGMLAAAKLLRGAEEAGHLEPLRAGAIGTRGLLAAALAALFTTHLVFAVAIGVGHSAGGMDPATSWATGGAMALLTAVFATATALTSQLAASRRRAVGIVATALGLALGLRVLAAASATPDWMWWTTPFGWIGFLHEVDQARGRVFLALGLSLVVLLAAAFATARRDLHGGVLGGASEVSREVRPVGGDIGLAVRLAAAPTRTWGLIVGVIALVFGLLARDFGEALADMPTTEVMIERQLGWIIGTTEGIIALTFSFAVLPLAVFAAAQVAAVREEEATWRIEHLLVRPVSRLRWLGTRVLVAAAAVVAVALGAGFVAWLGTVLTGTPITVVDGLLAGLNVIPVVWLTLGVGIGLFGLLPRLAVPLTYGFVVGAYLLDFVGGLLDLPEWVLDLSPYRHLASVPATDMNLGAALVMLVAGVVAAGVGLVAFRRRDLQEA